MDPSTVIGNLNKSLKVPLKYQKLKREKKLREEEILKRIVKLFKGGRGGVGEIGNFGYSKDMAATIIQRWARRRI